MTKQPDKNKISVLQKQGTLNPFPDKVQDQLFQDKVFFDPYDVAQVKYELIRKIQVDKVSISHATKSFGFSRLSFYRILDKFEKMGLLGLIPQKRGPQGAHKLTTEITDFIEEAIHNNPSAKARNLQKSIEETFGLLLHIRSIERAILKKNQQNR